MNEEDARSAKFNGTLIAIETGFVGHFEGVGKIVDYESEPTVTIELLDGTRITRRASRVRLATPDQIIEAQAAAIKKLKGIYK